ncbi:hypothetical protein OUZ56_033612 [Daphnia magna]|uniref:Uncharacterized protein n=1 Tax=Daphnia magna TaxID=35525 RepID=A0ABR0BB18_9CRUS|nr:hypothetical protein OUZ56_033612 [Daphnia magna]
MNESSVLRTTREKRWNVPCFSTKCHEQILTEMVSRSKRPFRASLFQKSKPGSYKSNYCRLTTLHFTTLSLIYG